MQRKRFEEHALGTSRFRPATSFGCPSPKLLPDRKSTVCTLSSSRPSAITGAMFHSSILVGFTFQLFLLTSKPCVGEFGGSPTARRCEAQASPVQARSSGQTLLGTRPPVLVRLDAGSRGGYSRERSPLASRRLPLVLESSQLVMLVVSVLTDSQPIVVSG